MAQQGRRGPEFLAPTLSATGRRNWVYPDRLSGPRARVRQRLAWVLMAVYALVPWLTWHGRPLARLDLLAGQVDVLGAVVHFAEVANLAFLLIGLAMTLFFCSALAGRIWCGFACPQTVFVDWLIRPIEELVEGRAHHRRAVDGAALSLGGAVRKAIKHLLFMIVSLVVANVFLSYFCAPRQVLGWMTASPLAHPMAFSVMATVMAAVYLDLSWFREQFCSFLCPYARIQSMMMDRQTPAVAYDPRRGEPRGKRAGGDCIDCGLCQRVCPTGIDIRAGLQLECIHCLRCADACDRVMQSLRRPLGLIRPVAASELAGYVAARPWQRPRVWLYGLGAIAAFTVLAARLTVLRQDLEFHVSRQPGVAFSHLPDGRLGNSFLLRTVNNQPTAIDITLRSESPDTEALCGLCATLLAAGETRSQLVVIAVQPQRRLGEASPVARFRHVQSGQEIVFPLLLPTPP